MMVLRSRKSDRGEVRVGGKPSARLGPGKYVGVEVARPEVRAEVLRGVLSPFGFLVVLVMKS